MKFSGIRPSPTSVSGNTVTWTITDMVDGVCHSLYVPLTPQSATNNGDTACNYVIINPTSGDSNPTNNIISRCDTIRGSWDPNEKSVIPEGDVLSGDLLTYTIDFENLGNDTAFNIHIQDTLSPYLDANSFVLLDATHYVVPYLFEAPGSVYILKFDFPRINLEDKSVPAKNKGQVRFSMKLKDGLDPGTEVPNRAGIYFDGNPVVLTNYSFNRIPIPNGVRMTQRNEVRIFPNPADHLLNIQVYEGGWISADLYSAIGQKVSGTTLHQGTSAIDIRHVPAGIYYLRVRGEKRSITEKIVKH